jgi:hypothetical protein
MHETLLRYLTIVPRAHVQLFEAGYQARLYDVFHRRALSLIGHAVCTPLVVGFLLAAAARVPGLPWAVAGALFLYYLRFDRLTGLFLLPALAALAYAGIGFAAWWGPGALGASLALMLAAATLQTFSHLLDPVPPPISGRPGFVPVGEWVRAASLPRMLLTAALTCTSFILLELFASFRVFACQGQRLLFRLGYAPHRWRQVRAEADRMLHSFAEGEAP